MPLYLPSLFFSLFSPSCLFISLSVTLISSSLCSYLKESFLTLFFFDSISLYLTTFHFISPFLVFLFLSLFSLFYIFISSFSAVCSSLLSFLSVVMCFVKVRGPSIKCIAKTRVTCAVADKRCAAEVAQRKRNNILHNNNSNNNEGNTQGRSKGGDARKVR